MGKNEFKIDDLVQIKGYEAIEAKIVELLPDNQAKCENPKHDLYDCVINLSELKHYEKNKKNKILKSLQRVNIFLKHENVF